MNKCFICSEELEEGYLCKKHATELHEMLINNINKIDDPDWGYHCQICGEYENRIIIEYPPHGYFCDIDITEDWKRYC